jgi:hypothetical protein
MDLPRRKEASSRPASFAVIAHPGSGDLINRKKVFDTTTAESILNTGVSQLPNLNHLSHAEKDALILAIWAQVQALSARIMELEAKLGDPPKTPDNSSLPPSKGQKPNQPEKARRIGPRQGSLGRKGGGRPLVCEPDETVTAKALACAHCRAALTDADQGSSQLCRW